MNCPKCGNNKIKRRRGGGYKKAQCLDCFWHGLFKNCFGHHLIMSAAHGAEVIAFCSKRDWTFSSDGKITKKKLMEEFKKHF